MSPVASVVPIQAAAWLGLAVATAAMATLLLLGARRWRWVRAAWGGRLPAWLLEPSEWDEARAATPYP